MSWILRLILVSALLAAHAVAVPRSVPPAQIWGPAHRLQIDLNDPLDHPFYWWPRTLLSYPIQFNESADLGQLVLRQNDGEAVPIQWSDVVMDGTRVRRATLNFFSDLPSGAHKQFVLSLGKIRPGAPLVSETTEGETIVLDGGALKVRIPASQAIHGSVPGPIIALSRGGPWFGSSAFELPGLSFTQIDT